MVTPTIRRTLHPHRAPVSFLGVPVFGSPLLHATGSTLLLTLTFGFMLCVPALGQRVLLFEDFEDAIPDLPANEAVASLGSFTRSEVLEDDPGTITVTGGQFPDPFGGGSGPSSDFDFNGTVDGADLLVWQRGFDPAASGATKGDGDADGNGFVNNADFSIWEQELGSSGGGNKSLVLYNPNAAVQQAANWFTIFPDDPGNPNFFFRNGTIEFDVFLEQVPSDGFWTFLGIRLGFELTAEDRGQVTTEGDQNIWNSFRMQDGGIDTGGGNILFDQVNTTFNANGDVVVTDQALRVRYEIDGNNAVYSVFIDNLADENPEVEVINDAPWTQTFNFLTFQNEPAPGINEITFITDASSRGIGSQSAGNVYLDNLRVIDFDQAPLEATLAATMVPEPNCIGLALALAGFVTVATRPGKNRRDSQPESTP